MSPARTRVLIVEDSLSIRRSLVELVGTDPELEVVAEAENGLRAIELCERLRPDVVSLDMMLPGLDGLGVTEHLMAYRPTPILIVSSSLERRELFKTYDALAAGAVDVLDKPLGDEFQGEWEASYLARLKLVARIKVITHPRARWGGRPNAPAPPLAPLEPMGRNEWGMVLMGASTGGPGALLEILRCLPPGFPLPILLVLHIASPFGENFVAWLEKNIPIEVRYPREGEPLPPKGRPLVIMAPPDRHLALRAGRLRLEEGPERHSCRPAVDVLFESVAEARGAEAIACLLTGMGRDGAAGLSRLHAAGAMTLAQDEATSVVFGMAREAIRLGAARQVLPLNAFAPTLQALALDPARSRP